VGTDRSQYGAPLVAWMEVAVPLLRSPGANKVYYQRRLLTADFKSVVSPNEDTLYSDVLIDLSTQDLIVTAPNVTDGRFWGYAFSDPCVSLSPVFYHCRKLTPSSYGNNFANIGSVTSSPPGRYLIRRATEALVEPEVTYCSNTSEFRGVINAPTTYSLLDGRIYLRQNTTQDLDTVHRYQDELTATLRNRSLAHSSTVSAPPVSIALLQTNGTFPSSRGDHLELLARLAPFNQPETYSDRWRVASLFGAAGIYNGHYHPQPNVNLTQASLLANASILAASTNPANILSLGNDWYTGALDLAGNFHDNYAYRAYIAETLYLQIVPSQAVYPRNRHYAAVALPANQSLLFTFSDIPPVNADGFWSLTVYNEDHALVSDPLNRYNIGTRDKLTFVDGTHAHPVSPNCHTTAKKPFQLLLQAADEPPPANWSSKYVNPPFDSFKSK